MPEKKKKTPAKRRTPAAKKPPRRAGHQKRVGVIGGSGLYRMDAIGGLQEVRVRTPFGEPSDAVMLGTVRGVEVAFLPRHGRGHRLLPGEINQRANMWALKSLGVEQILAFGAVGSLQPHLSPRTFVFPDQLVDRTRGRPSTFFGGGVVAHVALARPFCLQLSTLLDEAAGRVGIRSRWGGTLCCMEGPAFSTRAESEHHRRQGWDLIGMTVCPEAKLAREAELCYSPISMVTDYDCWKAGDEVSTEKVVQHLLANVENAQRLLVAAVEAVAGRARGCECASALKGSVFTAPQAISREAYARLELLIGSHVPQPKN